MRLTPGRMEGRFGEGTPGVRSQIDDRRRDHPAARGSLSRVLSLHSSRSTRG